VYLNTPIFQFCQILCLILAITAAAQAAPDDEPKQVAEPAPDKPRTELERKIAPRLYFAYRSGLRSLYSMRHSRSYRKERKDLDALIATTVEEGLWSSATDPKTGLPYGSSQPPWPRTIKGLKTIDGEITLVSIVDDNSAIVNILQNWDRSNSNSEKTSRRVLLVGIDTTKMTTDGETRIQIDGPGPSVRGPLFDYKSVAGTAERIATLKVVPTRVFERLWKSMLTRELSLEKRKEMAKEVRTEVLNNKRKKRR